MTHAPGYFCSFQPGYSPSSAMLIFIISVDVSLRFVIQAIEQCIGKKSIPLISIYHRPEFKRQTYFHMAVIIFYGYLKNYFKTRGKRV
jgi:hypothetical protein